MKNIFYIEDNPSISQGVKRFLDKNGFTTYVFKDFHKVKFNSITSCPDIFLVDWNLPDSDGEIACKFIRERYNGVPIIIITVNNQTSDIIHGFDIGADDYITKPFELEILLSRISALLRRASQNSVSSKLICANISLDKDNGQVFVGGKEVVLSSTEYQLLTILMQNKNRTVTRQTLLENIWDINGNFVNDNTLTVAVKRLRERLCTKCIKTIRSFGYRMEDE